MLSSDFAAMAQQLIKHAPVQLPGPVGLVYGRRVNCPKIHARKPTHKNERRRTWYLGSPLGDVGRLLNAAHGRLGRIWWAHSTTCSHLSTAVDDRHDACYGLLSFPETAF